MSRSVSDQNGGTSRRKKHGEIAVMGGPEEAMLATERYGQAMHDEIGLLHVRIALRLFEEDPDRARKFARTSRSYIRELQQSRKQSDKRNLSALDTLMNSIVKGEDSKVNVSMGMQMVEQLGNEKRKVFIQARDGYDRIFRSY
jgi:hypothetical protein